MINKLRSKTYKLLRKSEKFFQTDMVYLAKGGFWLTLGQIISSLSSFLLAIAFANLLPKEVYGTYKYILSLVGILSVFTLSGMSTSLIRSTARGFEGSLIPVLKEKIKWGSIGSLFSLGIATYYYLNGNSTLTISFIITAVFLPLIDSFGIYGTLLSGKKKFKLSTKYTIITSIISSVVIISVLIISKNIFLILFTYFISHTSLRFIFFKLTIKKLKPNSKTESGTISYGKNLSLMNVIGMIAAQIDKILVWHFIGPAQLAIYSIAIAPPEQIKGLLKNINTLALPKFAEKSIKEIKNTLYHKIVKLFLILVLIVGIYWFGAPYIFKLFFPQYIESVLYSQIFSLGLLNISIAFICLPFLQSQRFKKELYRIKIFSSIIQILLIFLLTYFYGLLGLIIARLITRLIIAIIYLVEFKKI